MIDILPILMGNLPCNYVFESTGNSLWNSTDHTNATVVYRYSDWWPELLPGREDQYEEA